MSARSIALLLAILAVSVFGVAQSTVDDYVLEQMKAKHIPSLELIVVRQGKIVKQRSYGIANVELNVPATNDNVYPIASITKVLTATATFLLIQDGKLRLDEPIAELLSGIPKEWNQVTVLNCLSHSSGIPDIPNIYDKFDYPLSEEAALAAASSKPMVYEPGEKSAYNQTEFILLKKIIEKISGVSYAEFLKQRIFSPLGISSAAFGDSRDVIPHSVTVYTRAVPAADRLHSEPIVPFVNKPDDPLFHSMLLFANYTYAGDGLNMTAQDLAKFDSALTQGKLLRPDILKKMWTPYKLRSGAIGDFSAGWMTEEFSGHQIFFHIGAGMAQYSVVPDSGLSVILLTNIQATKVNEISLGVLQYFTDRSTT